MSGVRNIKSYVCQKCGDTFGSSGSGVKYCYTCKDEIMTARSLSYLKKIKKKDS